MKGLLMSTPYDHETDSEINENLGKRGDQKWENVNEEVLRTFIRKTLEQEFGISKNTHTIYKKEGT
jgi:hypothetical protein